ncbi:MAG: right-handed parallel beta-helix repeat-containing protein, partial [Planctomycetes bacterium]|nr:right-handed parallel beta-helix repeat-containing protein [Planctomycetota bacterium]
MCVNVLKRYSMRLCMIAGILFTGLNSYAATYYVDASSGSAAASTNPAAPGNNIPNAITAAVATDNVFVAQGNYAQNLTMKNGVSIYGGYQTGTSFTVRNVALYVSTLNPAATNVVTYNASVTATIDGFTIDSAAAAATWGVYCNAGSVATVNNCKVQGNPQGGISVSNAPLTVTNSTIQTNTEENGIKVDWYEYSGGNLSVTNSTISSNGNGGGNDGGIFVYMYDSGWNGNHGNRTGTVTITGNTINSNNYNGIFLYTYVNDYNSPGTTLINATVSNNTIGSNTNYGLRLNASGYNTSMMARVSATVNGNTIQNHSGANDAGIYTVTASTDTRSQIVIAGSGNTINGNYYGIYQNNSYFENITLTEGTISGNTNYAVLNQYASNVLNVANNWWGV